MRGEIWIQLTEAWLTKICYEQYADSAAVQGCVDTQTAFLVDPVRPLGPWGDRSEIRAGGWDGDAYPASLHVAWDGSSSATTPDSLVRVLYAISGAELWLGREGRPYYGTIGSAPDEPISIYDNSAGFVVLLEADDGSRPATEGAPARGSQLLLTEVGADTTESGEPGTRYRVTGAGSETPQDVEWYFVPDVFRDNKPIIIAGSPSQQRALFSRETSAEPTLNEWEWRRPKSLLAVTPEIWVGRPRQIRPEPAFQFSPLPAQALALLDGEPTYTTFQECAGLPECVAPNASTAGVLVAVAVVGSGRWSVDSRGSQEPVDLGITCLNLDTPSMTTVPRGGKVLCDRNVTETVIARWKFVPDSAEFEPVEYEVPADGKTEWFGLAATSGTVWAYGWANSAAMGQPIDSGSARLEVSPRQWPKFEFPVVLDSGQGLLPYPPTEIHNLGMVSVDSVFVPLALKFQTLAQGPNAGFSFLFEPGFKPRPLVVSINVAALQEASTWWAMQVGGIDATTGSQMCGKTGTYSMSMSTLTTQIRQHEGIDPTGATSHVAVYKEIVKDHDLNAISEAIVQQEISGSDTTAKVRVLNRIADAYDTWRAFNQVTNKLRVDLGPLNPFNPPCEFRF